METKWKRFGFPKKERRDEIIPTLLFLAQTRPALHGGLLMRADPLLALPPLSFWSSVCEHLRVHPNGSTAPLLRGHGRFSVTQHSFFLLLVTSA